MLEKKLYYNMMILYHSNDSSCLHKGESYMVKYTIKVQPNWCKSCGVCVAFCPKQVLVLDEAGKARVQNLEACIGCRLCEIRCSDYAIEVGGENVGKTRSKINAG